MKASVCAAVLAVAGCGSGASSTVIVKSPVAVVKQAPVNYQDVPASPLGTPYYQSLTSDQKELIDNLRSMTVETFFQQSPSTQELYVQFLLDTYGPYLRAALIKVFGEVASVDVDYDSLPEAATPQDILDNIAFRECELYWIATGSVYANESINQTMMPDAYKMTGAFYYYYPTAAAMSVADLYTKSEALIESPTSHQMLSTYSTGMQAEGSLVYNQYADIQRRVVPHGKVITENFYWNSFLNIKNQEVSQWTVVGLSPKI